MFDFLKTLSSLACLDPILTSLLASPSLFHHFLLFAPHLPDPDLGPWTSSYWSSSNIEHWTPYLNISTWTSQTSYFQNWSPDLPTQTDSTKSGAPSSTSCYLNLSAIQLWPLCKLLAEPINSTFKIYPGSDYLFTSSAVTCSASPISCLDYAIAILNWSPCFSPCFPEVCSHTEAGLNPLWLKPGHEAYLLRTILWFSCHLK